MAPNSAVLAVLFAVAIWALQTITKGLTGPLRHIPGPWYARFTNLPLKWATVTGRRVFHVDALHRRYGPMVRIAPGEVACSSPETFRDIHRIGRGGFRKGCWYRAFTGYGADDDEQCTMFTMLDPVPHARRRKIMARAFSKSEIRRHWEREMRRKVVDAVGRMEGDAASGVGGEVDVMKWWVLMASDIASLIVFGESFDNLHTGEKNTYIKALEASGRASGINAELPLLKYLPLPSVRRLFAMPQTTLDWAAKTVDNSRKSGSAGVGNIFTSILAEAEADRASIPDIVLTREARSFILAGSDTTAVTLTFLVWCVLARPRLHGELVEELARAKEEAAALDDDVVAFSDERLEQLPLLNAVIRETLRLYGAAPGSLPRNPPPGGATVGGVFMPDWVVLSTQSWSLHRDPTIWERPEEFDATRWLKEGGLSDEARAAYNPFGGGARACIGMHIAEMELRCAVATFFSRYPKARLAPGTTDESMVPEYFFIINPSAHECRVVLS
ncbi:cytochrome p450 [Diplodia corticola]|uniref:Cytochrome p450 n=1 Tax=Diplodia corticola TaxID=236234 RepID=A0A1J9QPX8_9PEZI|nr:cytochrome p450 [Diplodia corticola]OJD30513.1 cytochrome p450 [Diplodia corticola]